MPPEYLGGGNWLCVCCSRVYQARSVVEGRSVWSPLGSLDHPHDRGRDTD